MRLLLLSDRVPPHHRGGAEVAVWRLAVALRRAGHDVHVATATPGPAREEHRDGLMVHYLHSRYPERFAPWLTLCQPQTLGPFRRLCSRLRPDVVHAHNVHHDLSYASLVAASRLRIAVVFTSHDLMPVVGANVEARRFGYRTGPDGAVRLPWTYELGRARLRYNPWRRTLVRLVLGRAVRVRTCVSDAHRKMLAENGYPDFEVVHNAADPAYLDIAPPAEPRPRRTLLFGGRLTGAKGAVSLGRIIGELATRRDDVDLVVLSRSPDDLARLGLASGVARRVGHAGWLTGACLVRAYHEADIVLVPSETFECGGSLMAIDAMAAARPVVASPYGGTPEYVVDGETGYLRRPEDPGPMVDAVSRLLDDESVSRRIGAAGRARVAEHFSLDSQVRRFLAIYARVAAS